MKLKYFLLLLIGLSSGLVWGSSPAACQTARLRVAASIVPLADFCREIGGDKVDVQLLTPPGASPHTFEPSPKMLANLTKAQVLVFIGAGLEPWLEKFLQVRPDKKSRVVQAAHGIDLITAIPGHAEAASGHSHAHGSGNPHIWLDPILVQDICRRLAAAFMDLDPENQPVYEQQLALYLEKLARLHQEIQAATDTFKLREFVGFHPSFTYFARRYNLREVGVIEVAPGREPTPKAFQKIIQAIRHHGIKVIFSEPQFSPRLAEVLAKEAGVSVLQLDPIGGRPPCGDSYLKLMRCNLAAMAGAMQ